jgi:hypothetical protein
MMVGAYLLLTTAWLCRQSIIAIAVALGLSLTVLILVYILLSHGGG